MPAFLEKKLKKEYGEKSDIPYKVMNKLGYMHGNKETAKGREAERKHKVAHNPPYPGKLEVPVEYSQDPSVGDPEGIPVDKEIYAEEFKGETSCVRVLQGVDEMKYMESEAAEPEHSMGKVGTEYRKLNYSGEY